MSGPPGIRLRPAGSLRLGLGLLLCVVLAGCSTDPAPEVEPSSAPPPARSAVSPVADPCVVSTIELRVEGGGDRITEEQAAGWLVDGLRGTSVQRREGDAGALRVVYLLTPLEGDAGWSLGVKALWEVMDGPLRQPISVDITRDLPPDTDLEAAGGETFTGLGRTLAFRCRLGTVPPAALPRLRDDIDGTDDLVSWARACGDRKIVACGDRLLVLMKDPRAQVAAAAILALGQVGVGEAAPGMVERTIRAEPLVVRAAVLGLSEIGTEEARRYLRLWSEGHPDPAVQELAREMLELD